MSNPPPSSSPSPSDTSNLHPPQTKQSGEGAAGERTTSRPPDANPPPPECQGGSLLSCDNDDDDTGASTSCTIINNDVDDDNKGDGGGSSTMAAPDDEEEETEDDLEGSSKFLMRYFEHVRSRKAEYMRDRAAQHRRREEEERRGLLVQHKRSRKGRNRYKGRRRNGRSESSSASQNWEEDEEEGEEGMAGKYDDKEDEVDGREGDGGTDNNDFVMMLLREAYRENSDGKAPADDPATTTHGANGGGMGGEADNTGRGTTGGEVMMHHHHVKRSELSDDALSCMIYWSLWEEDDEEEGGGSRRASSSSSVVEEDEKREKMFLPTTTTKSLTATTCAAAAAATGTGVRTDKRKERKTAKKEVCEKPNGAAAPQEVGELFGKKKTSMMGRLSSPLPASSSLGGGGGDGDRRHVVSADAVESRRSITPPFESYSETMMISASGTTSGSADDGKGWGAVEDGRTRTNKGTCNSNRSSDRDLVRDAMERYAALSKMGGTTTASTITLSSSATRKASAGAPSTTLEDAPRAPSSSVDGGISHSTNYSGSGVKNTKRCSPAATKEANDDDDDVFLRREGNRGTSVDLISERRGDGRSSKGGSPTSSKARQKPSCTTSNKRSSSDTKSNVTQDGDVRHDGASGSGCYNGGEEPVIDASFLVGKPLRLYCPVDRRYHVGRIIDWRAVKSDLSDETAMKGREGGQQQQDEESEEYASSSDSSSVSSGRHDGRRNKGGRSTRHTATESCAKESVSESALGKSHAPSNSTERGKERPGGIPVGFDPSPHLAEVNHATRRGTDSIATTEYLVRFRSGLDCRRVAVHQWLVLEEHAVSVGIALLWAAVGRRKMVQKLAIEKGAKEEEMHRKRGGSTKEAEDMWSWKPAQLMARTALEMVPVRELNPAPSPASRRGDTYGFCLLFGQENHAVVRLRDRTYDFLSPIIRRRLLERQRRMQPRTRCMSSAGGQRKRGQPKFKRAEAFAIAMACAEQEEQRRARRWHGLAYRSGDGTRNDVGTEPQLLR